MNDEAYSAFHESIDEVDHDPVTFMFTEEEAERFDAKRIDGGTPMPFSGEITFNLSEREYPFLRAALIFEMFAVRKT